MQLDFIRASEEEAEARLSEQRKQLEAMAEAQAERETALHDREEALKQRARVARVRNFALVVVSILLVLAGWLGWRAAQQKLANSETLTRSNDRLANGNRRQGTMTVWKYRLRVPGIGERFSDDPDGKIGQRHHMGVSVLGPASGQTPLARGQIDFAACYARHLADALPSDQTKLDHALTLD